MSSLNITQTDKINMNDARLDPLSLQQFMEFGQGDPITPSDTLIHRAFERAARRFPNAIAASHGDATITYAELNRQADALAYLLLQKGVSRGDHVGLFLKRSIPMLVGIMAVLKVGAVYVPQDARIAATTHMRHITKITAMKVILTLSDLRHLVPTSDKCHLVAIDEFMLTSKAVPTAVHLNADLNGKNHPCFVLFTSGTTGNPNGVQVTHGNVCNLLLTEPGGLGIRAGMIVAQILNISFDMAAWEIFAALTKGATLLIREKDIAAAAEQADVVIATPSILATVDPEKCARIKTVAVAGEPCPVPLANKWREYATFYNCCGPTEVTIVNTMHRYEKRQSRISIGKPVPNTTVYILNEQLQPCEIGEIGEMWAGGDCVSQGYLQDANLTNERYKPDPFLGNGRLMFRTRDLGRWNRNGELEHFGRTDDQVKVRGFRVELDSVSAALESVSNIEQAVTLKLDDRNLATFVTPSTVDTRIAKEAIVDRLPYYATPSLIHALDEMPRTKRGKIDKRALTILAVELQESLPC